MELLVVQYCREDVDFNQKKSKIGQKIRSCEVSKFRDKFCKNFIIFRVHKFVKNFTQFLGYTVCLGENMGEKKKSNNKNFGKKIWGEFF